MKTKIVYVLVSNDDDIFYEQALVSVYTLRHYNKDSIVCLVVDDCTKKTLLGGAREEMLHFINEVVVADVPSEFSPIQKHRFIKTNLRTIIEGDFFYIDGDTIVCGNLDGLDYLNVDIAAVPDAHCMACQLPWYETKNSLVKSIFGIKISPDSIYFNSGCVFVKDSKTSRDFFKLWHLNWSRSKMDGCDYDQPAFYYTNWQMGMCINRLSDIYNCQVSFSFTHFHSSLIIHYWGTSVNEYNSPTWTRKSFFNSIKNKGCLTDDIKNIALNCKTTIPTPSILLTKRTYYDFFTSEFGIRVLAEYERNSLFLKLFKFVLRVYQKAIMLFLLIKKRLL